jgi:hypothetical protein
MDQARGDSKMDIRVMLMVPHEERDSATAGELAGHDDTGDLWWCGRCVVVSAFGAVGVALYGLSGRVRISASRRAHVSPP